MNLHDLQTFFHAYLLFKNRNIIEYIDGDNESFIETRLDIYADTYREHLHELLSNDFPGLKHVAGELLFAKIIDEYIDCYPPKHFSPKCLGGYLEQFLQETAFYAKAIHLHEMAKFEFLLLDTLDAKNLNSLTLEDLQTIAPEAWPQLHFVLHPSVKLTSMYYNVPQIWRSIHESVEVPKVIQQNVQIHWLIWRDAQFRVCFQMNTIEQQRFMEAIQQRKCFAEICEGLCQTMDEQAAANYAAELLMQGLKRGLLVEIII